MPPDLETEKILAAEAAVLRVKPGMRLALGTGSTAAYAVRALAKRFPDGAGITAVASSTVTEGLAGQLGVKVGPLRSNDRFDLMLDGADEVTPSLDLTKGRGGALFREKFLARLSKEFLVLVDHTKLVSHLATRVTIPLEVVPFARPVLVEELQRLGMSSALRMGPDGTGTFRTDNGNEILDLKMPEPVRDPKAMEGRLREMAGVVESGIFSGLASRVYVGLPDGTVQELTPARAAGASA